MFSQVIFPVVLLIAAGYLTAKFKVIDKAAVAALSSITFIVFMPALLFRAMAKTEFANLSLTPALVYFGATLPLLLMTVAYQRFRGQSSSSGATIALTVGFSNLVMMGIPIVRLAFGEAGLAILLTVITFHSLLLLTSMTLVAELEGELTFAAFLKTIRSVLLHPVIVPILLGLLWSFVNQLTGFVFPSSLDKALEVLSGAAAPLSLVLLGASLAQFGLKESLPEASKLVFVKLVIHPMLVFGLGYLMQVDKLVLAVLVVGACMPAGANPYLFAQRYNIKLGAVSAAIGLSTILAVPLLAAVLHYFGVG
jgi:malonate transporter and related proteins